MALQVWLPLLGNLENQGVSDITVSNNGATVNNNGKIGKCYYFNGSSQWLQFSKTVGDLYSGDFSYAIWLKPTDKTRGIIFSEYSSSGASNVAFELTASLQVRLYWNGSPDIYATNCTLTQDVWTHVAITRSGNVAKFYINGVLTYTYSGTLSNKTTTACIRMGDDYRGGTSVSYQGYMNDARLYNHCLSDKEVKEISRALVGHYKLDDRFNAKTEIVNGFGELGTENWSGGSNSTDVPSADSTIKSSRSNSTTIELMPLDTGGSSYSVSAYFKTTGSTSGTTYPSILPYDVDKKFISCYNCPDGFGSSYQTTLAQPLKNGDTVIHATDLSAWTTGDNHYYRVAIFGYVDGHGNTYADMTYTQDCPAFGTKTDKSHIDKTNNTITLNSAFTGADRPAGTKICQATEGNTYYYPFGGISLSSITDWTFKTATITPGNANRLKYARYYKWYGYNSNYFAGVKIQNNKFLDGKIYDSSGYKYDGTKNGDLTMSTSSARHRLSTVFDGDTNAIKIPFNTMLGLTAAGKTQWSFCCWIYVSDFNTSKNWATIFGGPSGFEIETKNGSTSAGSFYAHSWGAGNVPYTTNAWHHIAAVDTTSETRWYLDGTRAFTGTSVNIPIGDYFIGSWQTAVKQNFKGRVSDFRIYATALSDADIKELYEVSASVDNKGNMHIYELIEE